MENPDWGALIGPLGGLTGLATLLGVLFQRQRDLRALSKKREDDLASLRLKASDQIEGIEKEIWDRTQTMIQRLTERVVGLELRVQDLEEQLAIAREELTRKEQELDGLRSQLLEKTILCTEQSKRIVELEAAVAAGKQSVMQIEELLRLARGERLTED